MTDEDQDQCCDEIPLAKRADSNVSGEKECRSSQITKMTRRDDNGKMGSFDPDGGPSVAPESLEKQRAAATELQTTMEDLTQKSSMPMSPTQENSESAYIQFDVQHITRGDNLLNGPGLMAEQSQPTSGSQDLLLARQHHSTFTDSTAHTYEENDTGHVHFDSIIISEGNLGFDEPSQDASFAPREEPADRQSYEPQTPAPVINPFLHKGSVMKGHEMFGATQPSSIGRHMMSAASSRPSPDVYDDFTSPVKQVTSSPLPGHLAADATPPLMSSIRPLLQSRLIDSSEPQVTIPRTSGVQSFEIGPRLQLPREPRPYVSMKESQERRKLRAGASSSGSDSDTEFSDIDDVPRRRLLKRQREQEIEKQLSSIGAYRHAVSSRPVSSSSGMVEIPSTGRKARRRSTQEEYLAQCEGRDARDSQNEDVIADSQSIVIDKENREATRPLSLVQSWANSSNETGIQESHITASPTLPAHTTQSGVLEAGSNPENEQPSSPLENKTFQLEQLSFPLQEVCMNRNQLRTPIASKPQVHSDVESTVPETSPADGRLQPMREIADISFEEELQEEVIDAPGFSQVDVEFENAIRRPSSPMPSPIKSRASKVSRATSIPNLPFSKTAGPIQTSSSTDGSESLTRTSKAGCKTPILELPITKSAAIVSQDQSTVNKDIPPHKEILEGDKEVDVNVSEDGDNGHRHEAEEVHESEEIISRPIEVGPKRVGLRTQAELKGPSKSLRRSNDEKPLKTYVTPRHSTRVMRSSSSAKGSSSRSSKRVSTPSIMSTPLSSVKTTPSSTVLSSPVRASSRRLTPKETSARKDSPVAASVRPQMTRHSDAEAKKASPPIPIPHLTKRPPKRKSTAAEEPVLPTRSSKRQTVPKSKTESSLDPLAGPSPIVNDVSQSHYSVALFNNMAFAVSYVKQQEERDDVTRMIKEQGGRILIDGFDSLFDLRSGTQLEDGDNDLTLSPAATRVGFTALIADEHSRKAKYMQALALGLPCVSGRWIRNCVSKGEVIDWAPYLLCAGQSSFLDNAIRSRILLPYSPIHASFPDTIANRSKLLHGKSVLLVTGKGRGAEEKRKAYVFLIRALGPARLGQVVDYGQARKALFEAQGQDHKWDLLYVDSNEDAAEAAVFGSVSASGGNSRKRKRVSIAADEAGKPAPKKVRIISDETVIQSLILGELLE